MQNSPRELLPVVAVFVVLLAIMWWGFNQVIDHRRHPNQNLVVTSGPVILEAGSGGHFRAPGTINGAPVLFLVDTGASMVAIPGAVARTINIKRGPRIQVQTASGAATAYLTRLDTVTLGGIVQHDVEAAIIPSMEQDSVLLGMTFLDKVTLLKRGGRLILEPQS